MPRDYYSILGLSRDATTADIKKAYRKLSKEWHPDKHKGDKEAESRFKEINEAYEVLGNEKKKSQYDQFGTVGGPGGGFGGGGTGGFDFSGFQTGDMGGLGDIFESFFGGRSRKQDDSRGRDMQVEVTIEFSDVVKGAEKRVVLQKQEVCSDCDGKGSEKGSSLIECKECGGAGQVTRTAQSFFGTIQQSMLCNACQGRGKVPEKPCGMCHGQGRRDAKSDVQIDIPAGIHDGQTLRVRGKGDAGVQGGQAGDLYVIVRVQPDERFQRDGDDIRTRVTVPVVDAILGTEITVTTVHGESTLKVPEGTQPETVLRMKGKGLPVLNASRTGDHFVHVSVEIPKKLTRKEKELMEEWRGNRQ